MIAFPEHGVNKQAWHFLAVVDVCSLATIAMTDPSGTRKVAMIQCPKPRQLVALRREGDKLE
jgi:hypothetical protein